MIQWFIQFLAELYMYTSGKRKFYMKKQVLQLNLVVLGTPFALLAVWFALSVGKALLFSIPFPPKNLAELILSILFLVFILDIYFFTTLLAGLIARGWFYCKENKKRKKYPKSNK